MEKWNTGRELHRTDSPTMTGTDIFWRSGIYKGFWNNSTTHVSQRVVYNDELRIGDSNSSYAEVAPRSSIPRHHTTLITHSLNNCHPYSKVTG